MWYCPRGNLILLPWRLRLLGHLKGNNMFLHEIEISFSLWESSSPLEWLVLHHERDVGFYCLEFYKKKGASLSDRLTLWNGITSMGKLRRTNRLGRVTANPIWCKIASCFVWPRLNFLFGVHCMAPYHVVLRLPIDISKFYLNIPLVLMEQNISITWCSNARKLKRFWACCGLMKLLKRLVKLIGLARLYLSIYFFYLIKDYLFSVLRMCMRWLPLPLSTYGGKGASWSMRRILKMSTRLIWGLGQLRLVM